MAIPGCFRHITRSLRKYQYVVFEVLLREYSRMMARHGGDLVEEKIVGGLMVKTEVEQKCSESKVR